MEPVDGGVHGRRALAVDGHDLLLVCPVEQYGDLARRPHEVGLQQGEAEPHGGPGVDDVASVLERLEPRHGRQVVGAGDHAVGAHDDGPGGERHGYLVVAADI